MTILGIDNKQRCFGGSLGKELYGDYHDHDWAHPCYDDHKLFIKLILECMQSGLSFEIILKKKQGYLELFYNLDPVKCAQLSDDDLAQLSKNEKIIRHAAKVYAIRSNAEAFLKIQKLHGSFSNFIWSFVKNTPIVNSYDTFSQALPSDESLLLSKALKKYGMKFIGHATTYAFMQAAGLVNDHLKNCHLNDLQKVSL